MDYPFFSSAIAGILTLMFFVSCIMFVIGREAVDDHNMALYWMIKIVAVGLGLIASVFMTVLWEEWAVWSLNKSLKA